MRDRSRQVNWKQNLKTYITVMGLFCFYCILANFWFGYVCPFIITVGLPCPGCGLTRAGVLLIKGRVIESIYMHPLLIPLVFGIILLVVLRFKGYDLRKFSTCYIVGLITIFTVYGVRMYYLFPDIEPMTANPNAILVKLISR